jgi:hypothetical protein
MTKKLKWRLTKLPTSEEVNILVLSKIISQEEAREILFTEEKEEKEKSADDSKQEIKFLKELVEKLSNNNRSQIIETIRYIEKPYYSYQWIQPYVSWCSSNSLLGGTHGASGNSSLANAVNCSASSSNAIDVNFSAIS